MLFRSADAPSSCSSPPRSRATSCRLSRIPRRHRCARSHSTRRRRGANGAARAQANGIRSAGAKFFTLTANERSLYGKKQVRGKVLSWLARRRLCWNELTCSPSSTSSTLSPTSFALADGRRSLSPPPLHLTCSSAPPHPRPSHPRRTAPHRILSHALPPPLPLPRGPRPTASSSSRPSKLSS